MVWPKFAAVIVIIVGTRQTNSTAAAAASVPPGGRGEPLGGVPPREPNSCCLIGGLPPLAAPPPPPPCEPYSCCLGAGGGGLTPFTFLGPPWKSSTGAARGKRAGEETAEAPCDLLPPLLEALGFVHWVVCVGGVRWTEGKREKRVTLTLYIYQVPGISLYAKRRFDEKPLSRSCCF